MKSKILYFVPLVAAFCLGVVLYMSIGKDPQKLETARLNQEIPTFQLASLENPKLMVNETMFKRDGNFRLLNVWATWCPSCKAEHAYLLALKAQGVPIIGLNYKDERGPALEWLRDLGDPYEINVYDPKGVFGFDLGVYGAPETYLVDGSGRVRHRHVGVMNEAVWKRDFIPMIESFSKKDSAS